MTEHAFAACGPNCVAHPIITDTADGREHENCLDDDTLVPNGSTRRAGCSSMTRRSAT